MKVEFDPNKDAINRRKHGVALEFGTLVFLDGNYLQFGSVRPEDGELRLKAIGLVGGKLWTAIFVMRGEAYRFISVRRSNDGEERLYRRA